MKMNIYKANNVRINYFRICKLYEAISDVCSYVITNYVLVNLVKHHNRA